MIVINPAKVQAIDNARRTAQIMARFAEIDAESVRPARAVSAYMASGQGEAPTQDMARLEELEAEAVALRAELQGLSA